jgi:L-amino acid N-acyltransferase YncA
MTGVRQLSIASLAQQHWPQVEAVYAAGIATGHATFESAPPSWEEFAAVRLADHRFVALDGADDTVLGWVAASAVSERCVYAGVVEHSVYVRPDAHGQGVGRRLLGALIDSTVAAGVWTIQSGIFPENRASLALHRSAGFRVVGTRERLGRMSSGPLAGQWRDVMLIERRAAD